MFTWKCVFVVTCLLQLTVCQQKTTPTPRGFRKSVEFIYNSFTNLRRSFRTLSYKAKSVKSQPEVPITTPFPCDLTHGRSPVRPTSVHRLRPGDIDVVGAMGDSIMAAYGANALDLFSIFVADREVSFAIGGAQSWRTVLTLPNILRLYNPKLVGFSRGPSPSWSHEAQFNVAEGFATSVEMPYQARLLVQRWKTDNRVNFQEDWKMVTILIGNNDFCSWICYDEAAKIMNRHRTEMIETLDYFRDNVPRLFVNVIAPPDLPEVLFSKFTLPLSCYWVNRLECSCLLDLQFQDRQHIHNKITEQWKNIDKQVTERPEYSTKEDFAVVFQPFTMNVTLPLGNGTADGTDADADADADAKKPMQDASLFAPDCFHFSQKLHAIGANALWNNLLQPIGSKSLDWNTKLFDEFVCPSDKAPYFYTARNSRKGT